MWLKKGSFLLIIVLFSLSGCVLPARTTQEPPSLSTRYAQIQQSLTPGEVSPPNISPSETTPEPPLHETEAPAEETLQIYLHPGLPEVFLNALPLEGYQVLAEPAEGSLQLQVSLKDTGERSGEATTWTYALVAPFFTLMDGVSFQNLQELWQGQSGQELSLSQVLVTPTTLSAMTEVLGNPDPVTVKSVSFKELQTISLTNEPFMAILPFEELEPQFKVLRIDGTSPIDPGFDPSNYPLSAHIWVEGDWSGTNLTLPAANYIPNRRTVLVMTGVTALTRATAYQMATRGETFPGEDIRDWLLQADITHISHEVPFAENCPFPDPIQENLIFCAAPERIALLEDIEADVIELTGNHLLDYGEAAASLTIQMYRERDWITYAGGLNLTEAQSPAKLSHHGNKLAFIGCNLPGPPNVWAAASKSGSASCGNFNWVVTAIQQARDEGYLPIVTLQYNEDYSAIPGPQMKRDFLRLAEAGAVVVNGSQAHTPKLMAFHQKGFLHFGLGNLFFDQMAVYYQDILMEGTRDEFIDRLVFYGNRLVSVELLTAKLEDYARPRPMTQEERETLLMRIFDLALDFQEERNP